MNNSINRISLDIHEHGSQAVLKAKNTDTGRKAYITLREGGTPYIIAEDCYAVFKATKPDGSILYNACTIENNEIIYEFTEQTCTSVGRCRCEIALYGLDDKLITSPRFALLVDGTIYPDGSVESTNEFSALTQMVSDTLEVQKAASEAADDANEAADNANDAAENSRVATGNANAATGNAMAATESANQAAQSANTASGAATQAAALATQSTQAANLATENANTAAARASESAEEANSASINANQAATNAAQTAKSLMVVGKAWGTAIHLDDAINQFLVGCRVFGKTTQDGTPTPEAPVDMVSVGARGSIGLSVCGGKNLIPYPYKNTSKTQGGITFNDNGDGSITINGTATTNAYFVLCSVDFGNKWAGGTADSFTVGGYTFSLKNAVNDKVVLIYESGITKNLFIRVPAGATVSNLTVYPQAEYGSVATDYEPYKGQTLSVSIPNGLPGIPVKSGGNYTDANSQQWVSNYLDFERGVYISLCAYKEFTGEETWYVQTSGSEYTAFWSDISALGNAKYIGMCLCSHANYLWDANTAKTVGCFARDNYVMLSVPNSIATTSAALKSFLATQHNAGTPLGILYQLATPIETPIPEEELASYASLHTYKDSTTVFNDAGAYMELEYVMDAKKYIDSLVTGSIAPARVE